MALAEKNPPSIFKNFGLSTISTIGGRGFRFVLASLIISRLGTDSWGEMTFAITVVNYLAFALDLGMGTYSSVHKTDDKNCDHQFFSNLVFYRFIFSLFIVAVFSFVLMKQSFTGVNTLQLYVLLLLIKPFGLEWLYQRKGYYGRLNFFQMIRQGILLGAVLTGLIDSLFLLIILDIISEAINIVIMWLLKPKQFKLLAFLKKPLWKEAWNLYPQAFPLFVGSIFITFHQNIDIIIIRIMLNLEQLGIYDYSYRIVLFAFFLGAGLSIPLRRQLSRLKELAPEKIPSIISSAQKVLIFIAISFQFFAFYFAEDFFGFIMKTNVLDAVGVVQILSCYLSISFLSIPLSEWLINHKDKKHYVRMTIVAGSVNLLLNLVFIPIWGIKGAAFATVLAELSVLIILLYNFIKVYKNYNVLKVMWPHFLQIVIFASLFFTIGYSYLSMLGHIVILGLVLFLTKYLWKKDISLLKEF